VTPFTEPGQFPDRPDPVSPPLYVREAPYQANYDLFFRFPIKHMQDDFASAYECSPASDPTLQFLLTNST